MVRNDLIFILINIWIERYGMMIYWNGFGNALIFILIKIWIEKDILFWSIKYCFKVITTGYNNDWLLKRPGSDIVL